MVQEVDVIKGDTLYDISRKFSGHGMYFPQILLFNEIQNPNLIYPGEKLRIPITQQAIADKSTDSMPADRAGTAKAAGRKITAPKIKPVSSAVQSKVAPSIQPQDTEIALSDLKATGAPTPVKTGHRKKTVLPAREKTVREVSTARTLSAHIPASYIRPSSPDRSTVSAVSGQHLFEAAVKAFRVDDCHTALELLDRYLAENSGSPLAADAHLYKAECYLKLSAH
jgi:LysM repeat protein